MAGLSSLPAFLRGAFVPTLEMEDSSVHHFWIASLCPAQKLHKAHDPLSLNPKISSDPTSIKSRVGPACAIMAERDLLTRGWKYSFSMVWEKKEFLITSYSDNTVPANHLRCSLFERACVNALVPFCLSLVLISIARVWCLNWRPLCTRLYQIDSHGASTIAGHYKGWPANLPCQCVYLWPWRFIWSQEKGCGSIRWPLPLLLGAILQCNE